MTYEDDRDEGCLNAQNINEKVINLVQLKKELNDKSGLNLGQLTKVIPNIVLQSLTRYLGSSGVENENEDLLETHNLLEVVGKNFIEIVYDDIKVLDMFITTLVNYAM